MSGSLRLESRLAQQLRYALRRDRHFEDTDAKWRQCIGNRVEYCRWRTDRAALADTLGASDARLGQRFQMMDFDPRDFGRCWHGIVGERAGQYVSTVVINYLFIERVGDSLRDAAMDLPFDDHRIDQTAGVFHDHKPLDLHSPGRDVDRHDR